MSNYTSKLKIRTADKNYEKFSLPTTHIGTTDFFKPSVLYCRRFSPGDKIDINTIVELRGKPMALPTMGTFKHSVRAFWVPQRVISKNWLAFITKSKFMWNGTYANYNKDQYITNASLCHLFLNQYHGIGTYGLADEISSPVTGTKYDITYVCYAKTYNGTTWSPDTKRYFNLTDKGRLVLSIFQACGYNIEWATYVKNDSSGHHSDPIDTYIGSMLEEEHNVELSTKPFLAVFKVLLDRYVPSQYEHQLEKELETWKDQPVLTSASISRLLEVFNYLCYDMDYFTSAWQNPAGPNMSPASSTTTIFEDPTNINASNTRGAVRQLGNGTTIVENPNNVSNGYGLTTWLLRGLYAVANYMTRNQIVGYRPVDKFLGHFGEKLNYILTDMCTYIEGNTSRIFVSDVTSTTEMNQTADPSAATEQGQLGGVAGKLVGRTGLSTNWQCKEHGFIVIIQSVIPQVGYVQGTNRQCLALDPWDTYTPEFDSLGADAIARMELFSDNNGLNVAPSTFKQKGIWGWTNRYASYKVGFDILSGDFRLPTKNTGMDCMHLFRMFDNSGTNNIPTTINETFLRGNNEQYDRIFMYQNGDVDHIYFCAQMGVQNVSKMQTISEALPLTDGQGQETEFDYGGSYMQ